MLPTITTDDIVLRKCSKCDAKKNLCVCLSCNLVFCDHMEEDHIFSHFISTQHAHGMNLKEKKIFDLSPETCDKDFIQNNNRLYSVEYSFDGPISIMMDDDNDSLRMDNRSERLVKEAKLMNINLVESLEDLRNENNNHIKLVEYPFDGLISNKIDDDSGSLIIVNRSERLVEEAKSMNSNLIKGFEDLQNENRKLLTTMNDLTQEKMKQDEQINEINEYLVNERLTNKELVLTNKQLLLTNKQLVKQFDKSQQDLNKLKLDFDEEKLINQQLINNQRELNDEMKKKDKEIKELQGQVNDLILHINGGDKLKEALGKEVETSKVGIRSRPTRDRRK